MLRLFTILLLLISVNTIHSQIFENLDVHQADTLITINENNDLFTILDVRTQGEYNEDHLVNAYMRDFYATDFRDQLDALNKNRIYLIYCRSGNRSGQAFDMMKELGFQEVYNMLGGITSWKNANYPVTQELPEEQDLSTSTSVNNLLPQTIQLSPNPTSTVLQLPFHSFAGEFSIYNSIGKLVYRAYTQETTLPVYTLPRGIYRIQLQPKTNKYRYVASFIKI